MPRNWNLNTPPPRSVQPRSRRTVNTTAHSLSFLTLYINITYIIPVSYINSFNSCQRHVILLSMVVTTLTGLSLDCFLFTNLHVLATVWTMTTGSRDAVSLWGILWVLSFRCSCLCVCSSRLSVCSANLLLIVLWMCASTILNVEMLLKVTVFCESCCIFRNCTVCMVGV